MSANAINNVLWPHRATIPIMFLSSIYSKSTAGRPGRPMSFMGTESYISRYKQRMLQVSKTAFSGYLAQF